MAVSQWATYPVPRPAGFPLGPSVSIHVTPADLIPGLLPTAGRVQPLIEVAPSQLVKITAADTLPVRAIYGLFQPPIVVPPSSFRLVTADIIAAIRPVQRPTVGLVQAPIEVAASQVRTIRFADVVAAPGAIPNLIQALIIT